MNYEEDLKIDPDQLDVECLNQAEKFFKYSEQLAYADKAAKKAHEKVKVIRSELVKEAREEGAKNANQEEAYYRTNRKHKEAKDELIEAEFEKDLLQASVFAFSHRKTMLENLIRLHGQNYFAGPEIPRDLKEFAENYDKMKGERAKERVKKSIKKRRSRS